MQYKPEGISKKVFYQVRTFMKEIKLHTHTNTMYYCNAEGLHGVRLYCNTISISFT